MSSTALGVAGRDPELELHVPANDVAEPELSIVIPALNEELTIGDFVGWCRRRAEGGRRRGRDPHRRQLDRPNAETSRSPTGRGCCARPSAGSGAPTSTRSRTSAAATCIMGDCDCTYDFRELAPFVEKFRGRRRVRHGLALLRATSSPARCPRLHRYLGTPVTTWILNVIFGSRILGHPLRHARRSRATRSTRMDLRSQSWEYASEMVLKSVHMRLRTEEVPIRFLKDREGRTQPPQARGLVLALAGGAGSTCGRCSSTAPTSSSTSPACSCSPLGLLLDAPAVRRAR